MRQRLKHWLFQRGKNCKHCCLWCEYYDLCSGEIGQERQTYKARMPDGREIVIKTVPGERTADTAPHYGKIYVESEAGIYEKL